MFSNGKSITVWPVQKDELIQNTIDCRLIDVQQKIQDLLTAGYQIYDVAANNGFNALISATSGNRICAWKSAGSTYYTLYSSELASNGTNVIINAQLNNMNLVTNIRECVLSSTQTNDFANKAEFYGGHWYLANWSTGANAKFTNCDVNSYTNETYMDDVYFDYCNVNLKKSANINYSTYKQNVDTRFVNMTTTGSTAITLTIAVNYTAASDWMLRNTFVDFQNTGTAVWTSTEQRTFNFTGVKLENSDLAIINLYSTEGSKIYYEGQDLTLTGGSLSDTWQLLGSANISASSGQFPSMAVDTNGIPYVAFQDNANSDKASCYKYGSTGWSVVGYAGLSSNAMDYINLCISTDNDIVIVGRDNSSKASAYYLSAAASSWNLLGSRGFSTNLCNYLSASYFSTGSNKIFTAMMTNTSASPYVDLYIYNYTLSSGWDSRAMGSYVQPISVNVNNEYYAQYYSALYSTYGSQNIFSIATIRYVSTGVSPVVNQMNYSTETINKLSISYPYVTLIDASSKVTAGQVSGTSWTTIGQTQFSTGTAQNLSMTLINSVPYVAIQDTTAKATVYKYVSANSSWNLVGTAQFSTEDVTSMSLASFGNTPYLAVQETAAEGITAYTFGETITNSNINYTFENLESDVFDGEATLDITNIQSSSNYIVQNCNVRPVYDIANTVVGNFIRNEYNIELSPRWNPPVDDLIKETNADTEWVIKRADVESELTGKIVKNLKLYNSDLSAYTYNKNDNFFIVANNAISGNAVFMYYNNKVKGTRYSDWYLDASYTIKNCFHILDVAEISDLQNVVPSTIYADGPLENGSIRFISRDNEDVV